MCQSKSQGGKRCLAHSAGTKFITRMVKEKTGASDETIKESIKELAREGKNVDTPSKAEVQQWIDTRRFATEIDPELNDHERKIQLNQIDRAKEETKTGVEGKAWHVWKNLKTRVQQKMKTIRKAAIAIGLTGALAFGIAGCSNQGGVGPTDVPSPSPTTSTSQVFGEAIPKLDANGNPIIITDEAGEYQKITISPDDETMKLDPAIIDQSMRDAGWSDEDILSAQQFTATFVAEEGIDSIAFDTPNGWEAWKASEASNAINKENIDLNKIPEGSDRVIPILNNSAKAPAGLSIRDGSSRFNNVDVSFSSIKNWNEGGENYINIVGSSQAEQRINDDETLRLFEKTNPDVPKEEIIKQYPNLADGKENKVNWTFDYSYFLQKTDSGWNIAGFNNSSKYEIMK